MIVKYKQTNKIYSTHVIGNMFFLCMWMYTIKTTDDTVELELTDKLLSYRNIL